MGSRTDISSIAFETIFDISEQQPFLERVLKSASNWTYTNWKGMTFGILFGATLLSLLRLLPLWRLPKSGFLAALQGLIGGAPLGVCVNCATPIAQGLHRAGIKLETMLAVMTASPTLNFIVITMMFSLFTVDFVLIKLIVTLFFISVLIPALVWAWAKYGGTKTPIPGYESNGNLFPGNAINVESDPTWVAAIRSSSIELLANLAFLLRITVPLMLLAGLLGALLIESISLEDIANLPTSLSSYALIAIVGTFLPVPIAFDVVITSVLINVGLPPGLAMTLFFSLSIFSVFPFLIIGRDISWKLSGLLVLMVITVAISAGIITEEIHHERVIGEIGLIDSALNQLKSPTSTSTSTGSERAQDSQLNMIITQARELCSKSFEDAESCLENLLAKNTFGAPDGKLCKQIASSDPQLADHCQITSDTDTQAMQAIESDNIALCASFSCRMIYLKANNHKSGSINQCGINTSDSEAQLCRRVVLQHRIIYFRSQQACDQGLSDLERRYCQNEVEARISMEQLNLDTCRDTQNEEAKNSCLIMVAAIKVQDYGDEFNCQDLGGSMLVLACRNQQSRKRALTNRSIMLCKELPGRESKRCLIDVIKAKLQDSRSKNLMIADIASDTPPKPQYLPANLPEHSLPAPIEYEEVYSDGSLRIGLTPALSRPRSTGKFVRHSQKETNLSRSWKIGASDLFEPFVYGKGISSGDINHDGYPDLAVAFERGIHIYYNLGDGTFGLNETLLPENSFNTFVVALIDINNDGWLDVFSSGYGGRQLIYLNVDGQFKPESSKLTPVSIPASTNSTTMAAGFADLDLDGDLDIVLGKWSHGIERNFRTSQANNELWLNQSGVLEKFSLFDAEPPGSTLSVLLSDLNGDSRPDIIIGNDRQVPDIYYLSGDLLEYSRPLKGTVPQTSLNTMSYESADFNNDLKLDIFSTDMTFTEFGRQDYCGFVTELTEQQHCKQLLETLREVGNYNADACRVLSQPEKVECLVAIITKIAIRDKNPELCIKIPQGYEDKQRYCLSTSAVIPADRDINLADYPPQLSTNKLLMAWGTRFIDVTADLGVERSNWSWNARAFDADNDRYQDILVGTGYGFGAPVGNTFAIDLQIFSNTFFHSQLGTKFVRAETEFGLENYINTSAFTVTDYDLDGDLDVIEYGQVPGISILENRVNDRNTISFAFKDMQGNRFCIGCKVIVTSPSGQQLREIKASGGFLSYDEPIAHFGLGLDETISRLEIQWSTGESSILDVELKANNRYQITRQ